MNSRQTNGRIPGEGDKGSARAAFDQTAQDPELDTVLRNFRASVHAWSEATYQSGVEATYQFGVEATAQSRIEAAGRSRALVLPPAPRRILWNRSLAWSLSLVLTAGVATTGIYEFHQKEVARDKAIQQEIEHQRQLAQQHARDVDELLARVDSDVSREAPTAMEPLASLMADDETQ